MMSKRVAIPYGKDRLIGDMLADSGLNRPGMGGATVTIGPVTTDSGLNGPTIGPETTEDKDKRERHERARAFALSFSSQ